MSIPSVQELERPVLRALAGGDVITTGQMTQRLATEFRLTRGELSATREDGRPLFQNRIEWARTHLKKQGLVEYPRSSASRITAKGLALLEDPRLHVSPSAPSVRRPTDRARGGSVLLAGSLEEELRTLTGPAVEQAVSWEIVRRLNGWGPSPPATYRAVAKDIGMDSARILELGRACRQPRRLEAPLLDMALGLVLERPELDPDELAMTLVRFGITEDAFSMAGLCEAARRFGRFDEWRELVRQLAASRATTARPRPFESWFEIDVFLYVSDLGHRVLPQKRIGNYRVDMLLPDFVPQLIIECDGDRFHGRERLAADEVREKELQRRGYALLRFKYSDYKSKPRSIEARLAEILSSPESVGLQLRVG